MASGESLTIRSEFLRYLYREPFTVITVWMSNGEKFELRDPSVVGIGEQIGFVHPRDGSHKFFDLAQISFIEVEPDIVEED